ncbi:ferric reductase-like transmembrane domain-containing protein [Pseudonocardia sp. WMMC193]|uniref:ferredoxin reductase family protein n=1 Tax=Pseudonocardia sp. WMMC193 TaxID=2911965 RepID=UPI001F27EF44|nr:ferric reductase-like transmembrane domain-containing protein [Pseudonocardia sp. WMMC193]MCF7552093.1 ferric reductase-like transmembrane domain-containing protein [Pseudonocardia sp. WMMC193]
MDRTTERESRDGARGAWAAVLLVVLAGPAVAYLLTSPTTGLWKQLSSVTGLVALSALVCTACLPSRLRGLTRTFGIETVVGLHRQLGILCAVLIALHLAAVVAANPAQVALLLVPSAPARAQAAVGATVALALLVVLALERRRIRARYEVWRWMHLFLAVLVLGGSALHVLWLKQMVTDAVMAPILAGLGLLVVAVFVMRWWGRSVLERGGEFVVAQVRAENPTVTTVVLSPQLRFSPGQFAWMRLQRSAVEEHPFTIASSAHDPQHTEFTIRGNGDFAASVRELRPGDSVWVDGPYGSFTSDAVPTQGLVLIAAGVGITPMISMLRTAADRGDQRPHRLVYVARDAADLLFRQELAQLRHYLDLEVTEVLRRPSATWTGATGEIDVALLNTVLATVDATPRLDYFLCGPPSMVDDVLAALTSMGVPDDRIHTEQFDMA